MKKIDIVKPYAMASIFANDVYTLSGTDDFEIPAATSTDPQDTCVQDDGFLPITSEDLDDGGKAPERKNFNGLFYLATDQRNYLQNGGYITFDSNVSTAIGGYPEDAVLDYIDSNGVYYKVKSLIDDNTYNFITSPAYIDGTHWDFIQFGGDFANKDLSNLTATGQKVIDGQWVKSRSELFNGSWAANTEKTFDLTSYLPDDTYNYEILLGVGVTSGSTTGNAFYLLAYSSILGDATTPINFACAIAKTTSSMSGYGNLVIPIGTDRILYAKTINSNAGSATLNVYGYRRIGTNS